MPDTPSFTLKDIINALSDTQDELAAKDAVISKKDAKIAEQVDEIASLTERLQAALVNAVPPVSEPLPLPQDPPPVADHDPVIDSPVALPPAPESETAAHPVSELLTVEELQAHRSPSGVSDGPEPLPVPSFIRMPGTSPIDTGHTLKDDFSCSFKTARKLDPVENDDDIENFTVSKDADPITMPPSDNVGRLYSAAGPMWRVVDYKLLAGLQATIPGQIALSPIKDFDGQAYGMRAWVPLSISDPNDPALRVLPAPVRTFDIRKATLHGYFITQQHMINGRWWAIILMDKGDKLIRSGYAQGRIMTAKGRYLMLSFQGDQFLVTLVLDGGKSVQNWTWMSADGDKLIRGLDGNSGQWARYKPWLNGVNKTWPDQGNWHRFDWFVDKTGVVVSEQGLELFRHKWASADEMPFDDAQWQLLQFDYHSDLRGPSEPWLGRLQYTGAHLVDGLPSEETITAIQKISP